MCVSRGLDRYVTDISAGCKQFLYPETTAQQDASSGAERSVADTTFATRSEIKSLPTRSSEPCKPPVNLLLTYLMGKIRRFVQDQRIQFLPPKLAGRDSVLEETLFSKPSEILVVRIPMKSLPYRQMIFATALPEVRVAIPVARSILPKHCLKFHRGR